MSCFLDENWLNAVYYSISPTGELIAFGHGSKLILLSSHWSNPNQLPSYSITWKGELENPNDIITSIITLPIYGPNVSSGAEWTCIGIGLSSGLVLFYSDSGIQIFSQKWHQEPVQTLKAQSGYGLNEEIYVGYLSCVCILQTNQLLQTLKGLKQNLSKNLTTTLNGSNSITGNSNRTNISQFPDTIPCKKWEYRNRIGTINDSVVVGTQKSCTFNHLLEHSIEKGFYAKCRSSPTQNSLVLGVGVKPYVGFYYAKEGYVQADFGDVAKAVANKVISSLPTWLFKSSSSSSNNIQQSQDETQQIPSGEPMICRFGICDIQRQGFNVYLSPDHNLAVVTDNLNRIILIDCNRGVALRIWKGYRDAQCSFIRAKEKSATTTNKKGSSTNENEKRKALFLVIYAPRRSCLEIWALQHGPKVAAFTVCKNGQLIYNTHGLIGINPNVKVKTTPTNMCLFFDPNDETIKEICVPFHCALSEANSKTAKDLHLLRRLKLYLRGSGSGSNINNEEEIISGIEMTCMNLQTDEIRLQCLEMLAKNKKVTPKMFYKAILALKQSLNPKIETEDDAISIFSTVTTITEIEVEISASEIEHQENIRKLLQIELENYHKLVEFYISIKLPPQSQNSVVSSTISNEDSTNLLQKCNNEKLCLSENDLETLQKLLDLNQIQQQDSPNSNNGSSGGSKVTFIDKHNEEEDFIEFLNIFTIDTQPIQLKSTKIDLYGSVGRNLFNRFLEKGQNLQIFIENSKKSTISSEDFILLVFSYWLEKPFIYSKRYKIPS